MMQLVNPQPIATLPDKGRVFLQYRDETDTVKVMSKAVDAEDTRTLMQVGFRFEMWSRQAFWDDGAYQPVVDAPWRRLVERVVDVLSTSSHKAKQAHILAKELDTMCEGMREDVRFRIKLLITTLAEMSKSHNEAQYYVSRCFVGDKTETTS